MSRGPIGHPPCCAWATIRNGREKHGLGQEKRSGGLHEGDAARVFSRPPDEWVDRKLPAVAEDNFHRHHHHRHHHHRQHHQHRRRHYHLHAHLHIFIIIITVIIINIFCPATLTMSHLHSMQHWRAALQWPVTLPQTPCQRLLQISRNISQNPLTVSEGLEKCRR